MLRSYLLILAMAAGISSLIAAPQTEHAHSDTQPAAPQKLKNEKAALRKQIKVSDQADQEKDLTLRCDVLLGMLTRTGRKAELVLRRLASLETGKTLGKNIMVRGRVIGLQNVLTGKLSGILLEDEKSGYIIALTLTKDIKLGTAFTPTQMPLFCQQYPDVRGFLLSSKSKKHTMLTSVGATLTAAPVLLFAIWLLMGPAGRQDFARRHFHSKVALQSLAIPLVILGLPLLAVGLIKKHPSVRIALHDVMPRRKKC